MNSLVTLDSPNPKARRQAVREIAATRAKDRIPDLTRMLRDNDREVCLAAIDALATVGGSEAVGPLMLSLADERDWFRDAVDEALLKLDEKWEKSAVADGVIEGFLADLQREESPLNSAAVNVANRPGDPDTLKRLRAAIIERGAEGVALALERRGVAEGPISLVRLLTSAEAPRRKLALETLRLIAPFWGESEAVRGSVSRIAEDLNDPDPAIRSCSAEILKEIGGSDAIKHLIHALSNEGHARNVAEAALDAIDPGWTSRPEAVEVAKTCVGLLASTDPSVRYSALLTLGRLGSKSIAPHFARALVDENRRIRREASACLERLAPDWKNDKLSRLAVPVAIGALDHPNEEVRRDAQSLLAEIGGRPAAKALLDRLEVKPEAGLIKALGAIGDPRAVSPLIALLLNEGAFLQKHAVTALSMIDPEWTESEAAVAARPEFARTLAEAETPEVRAAAARGLGEIGDESAIDPLRTAAAAAPSLEARRDAANALDKLRARLCARRQAV